MQPPSPGARPLAQPGGAATDEPETGLDQQGLEAMWDIIRRDNTKRTIISPATTLSERSRWCDEAAVLDKGKLAFSEKSCNLTLGLLERSLSVLHDGARP
jgi:ABC-type multidrug transport system ATPase subunit